MIPAENNFVPDYYEDIISFFKQYHSYLQRYGNAETSLDGESGCDPGTAAHAWEHDITSCHSQLADRGAGG